MTSLRRSRHEGGYDSIFLAYQEERPIAVVRLNNRFKTTVAAWPGRPRRILSPANRLEREWTIYEKLAPLGLSPAPLWRCPDAAVCEYDDAPRLRTIIERRLAPLETAIPLALDAVHRMHALGVSHQDLTPGNILVCCQSSRACLIDFEYEPGASRTFDEQCEFDLLLLMAKLLARGILCGRFAELDTLVAECFLDSPCRDRLPTTLHEMDPLDLDPRALTDEAFRTWYERRIASVLGLSSRSRAA